jgi:hypothetical protein
MSRLKGKRAPRFYAQFSEAEYDLPQGWKVWDRCRVAPQGDVLPIALATGRHTAYRLRDALNKTEPAE